MQGLGGHHLHINFKKPDLYWKKSDLHKKIWFFWVKKKSWFLSTLTKTASTSQI